MLGVNPTNPAAAHLPTIIHQALCLRDPDRRLRRVPTTLRNSTRTRACRARAPNPPNTNSNPDQTRIRSRRRKIRFHRELTYRNGAGGAQSCASALPGALAVCARARAQGGGDLAHLESGLAAERSAGMRQRPSERRRSELGGARTHAHCTNCSSGVCV